MRSRSRSDTEPDTRQTVPAHPGPITAKKRLLVIDDDPDAVYLLVDYRPGSALDMPFDDNSFDVVWTQHAAMNIADKPKLYSEIARVLRPDGRFAMYDVLAGPVTPLYYPVPWARDTSISSLATPDQLRELLEGAGLEIISWRDTSEIGRTWFKYLAAKMQEQSEPPAFGFHVLLGPDFRQMAQNQVRKLNENRIVLIECIARKTPIQ